jgi:hypothetical protein
VELTRNPDKWIARRLEQAREALRTALQSGDIETIRPLVRALVAEVIVDDGDAKVRYHIPF